MADKRFSVIEYSSFFAVRHNATGREHPMGDGVDALFDKDDKPLTPGTPGFIEAWEAALNSTPNTTLAAYFSDEEEVDLDIRYRCPECGHRWVDQYSSACDSDCPNCGTRDIEAFQYKEVDREWTTEEESQYLLCDRCECQCLRADHRSSKTPDGKVVMLGCTSCSCPSYAVQMP